MSGRLPDAWTPRAAAPLYEIFTVGSIHVRGHAHGSKVKS